MVSMYVQLLARRQKGRLDKDSEDFIGFAWEGATRAQALIDSLLEFARVGARGAAFEEVACETVFDQVMSSLQVAREESGAVITRDRLPVVRGDGIQFAMLMQNLIGNAIKFRGKEPPRIHVGAERGATEWVFSVKDNGIGIEPQFLESLFVIFRRLHTREKYPGTGIGLSICKKIVQRHGGRIWVESQSGRGATFKFTLPVNGERSGPDQAAAATTC